MHLAYAYITALTGDANTVMDWRVINDRDKGDQGRNLRGSLLEVLPELESYNTAGWGVFVCINAMKDGGRKTLDNVDYIRTHVVDLDDKLTAHAAYQRAISSDYPPHIA